MDLAYYLFSLKNGYDRDIAQTSEGIDGTTGGIWKQRIIDMITEEEKS